MGYDTHTDTCTHTHTNIVSSTCLLLCTMLPALPSA